MQIELIAVATGVLLGAAFFGGLWWTVKNCLSGANPALWFLASLLVRTTVVLAGFYFICPYGWQAVVLCVVAFLSARWAVKRLTLCSDTSHHAS